MSLTLLTFEMLRALAMRPDCGAAPNLEFRDRLVAIAVKESGGNPLSIGVNPDPAHGLPAIEVASTTAQEAAAHASALLAQGRSIDLGLMQINNRQLSRHGLSIAAAFDACASMKAGADHYAADVASVWSLAHRVYNTGSIERGAGYAADVEQVLRRVRNQSSAAPVSMVTGDAQPLPAPPPCAPAWDAWALAQCSAHIAPAPAPVSPVAAITTTGNADDIQH